MHLEKYYSFLVQDFRTKKAKAEQMDVEKSCCKKA
jgi:hypothetical protein